VRLVGYLKKRERCLYKANFRISVLAFGRPETIKIPDCMKSSIFFNLILYLLYDFLQCEVSQGRNYCFTAEQTVHGRAEPTSHMTEVSDDGRL
jgi:hypothetical protein